MKGFVFLLFLSLLACESKTAPQGEVRDLLPKGEYALLIVESEGCIYCKQLRKDLQSQTLAQELQGMDVYSILYESNAQVRYVLEGRQRVSTEEELAKTLKVNSFPQLFFYDKEGKIILHLPGYQPPKNLLCGIRFVKEERYKTESYASYARRCM